MLTQSLYPLFVKRWSAKFVWRRYYGTRGAV